MPKNTNTNPINLMIKMSRANYNRLKAAEATEAARLAGGTSKLDVNAYRQALINCALDAVEAEKTDD